jgi:hypothetical protein
MGISKAFSVTLIGIAIAFLIFFGSIVSLVTDWWWYSEVGFTEIFIKSLIAKIIVGAAAGLLAGVFLLTNLSFAIRSKIPWMVSIPEALIGTSQPLTLNNRIVGKLGIIVTIIISFFIGLVASSSWHDVLKFLSRVPFGQVDPIFRQDVSFYVFSLPVYSLGLGLIKIVILLSLISCALIYILQGKLNLSSLFPKFDLSKLTGMPKKLHETHSKNKFSNHKATFHIGFLLFLFLANIAISAHLSLYNLLTNQS